MRVARLYMMCVRDAYINEYKCAWWNDRFAHGDMYYPAPANLVLNQVYQGS